MEVSGQLHTPAALFSRERDPDTHWIGPRAGLDVKTRRKSFAPARNQNPVIHLIVSHYTD
jgi:hypothetical protein